MQYTAVIRTLGKAGEKYQQLLNSLFSQTIRPNKILVYIAEGYDLPKETIGIEQYVYVKKGMVAQRALQYDEVETEYVLFLDDDLFLPVDFVEKMFNHLLNENADVISPDIYPNDKRGLKSEIFMTLSGRMRARRYDSYNGYKVMNTTGYSYNKNIKKDIYKSNTNAGGCFLCKKSDFLRIRFCEELWLDKMSYAIGDDQVMYYKMYLMGLKQLTYYNSGIRHLDAGLNLNNKDKERNLVVADYFFRRVFFERFLYEPETSKLRRFWKLTSVNYFFFFGLMVSLLKFDFDMFKRKYNSIADAKSFIVSEAYLSIPKIRVA